MDHAVALVRSYLQVNGFLTVTEFPVLELLARGRYQAATDIDVVAFRLPRAGGLRAARRGRPPQEPDFEPDPALGLDPGRGELLLIEVKQGRAVLNRGARHPAVLRAVLRRFGCCTDDVVDETVERLLAAGEAELPSGVRVRLLAFGATAGPGQAGVHHVTLGQVLEFLRAHLHRHWAAIRTTQITDPAFGFLALLKKAEVGGGAVVPNGSP